MPKSYAEIFAELGRDIAASRRAVARRAPAPAKSSWGNFLVAGLGVAAIAVVGYVAWQILRDDAGAWVDDDFDVD